MDRWPALPYDEWRATCATLHMWTQIVGKLRLANTPRINHWWNVPLYVSARGLTTTELFCDGRGFEVEFDFVRHALVLSRDDGTGGEIPLRSQSVAHFYRDVMARARDIGLTATLDTRPCEVPDAIRFDEDTVHKTYVPEHAHRFWRVLTHCARVFTEFRARFIGKSSPVHFFWGSFDLAVTRFSGRPAPPREGADAITREAYSHECISHGFWPGNDAAPSPAFYAYSAPEPAGFARAHVAPRAAAYDAAMKEFLLPYDAVRNAVDPDDDVLRFMQSTYEAGAQDWDRASLERASLVAGAT